MPAGKSTVRALPKRKRLLEEGYIIELGPVGGPQGGELLYQGLLPGLLKLKSSPTVPYLKAKLNR